MTAILITFLKTLGSRSKEQILVPSSQNITNMQNMVKEKF